MINLCKQCTNTNIKSKCDVCNGNPKLVDNFNQKDIKPLREIVHKSGYEFGSTNNRNK